MSYNIPFTKEELQKIKQLYLEQKRGIQFIAKDLNSNWPKVRKALQQMNIVLWTRSELQESNRHHYGPTKGFSGHKHKKESRQKISNTLLTNCNRTATGSKSQFIQTILGKVQGSFELAFLQKCINQKQELPRLGSTVKTPLGLYFPDFEYNEKFIEVKSPFTWRVCQGLEKNPKGFFSDKQHRKIKWTTENIKPVEIVILTPQEVLPLFRQAINNEQLTLEDIIYKNGKYFRA